MKVYRGAFAEINLTNLEQNVFQISKKLSKNIFICPMIKANAYGHGDIHVAKSLEKIGIKNLGVCLIEEAIGLRKNKVKNNIILFGDYDKSGIKEMLRNKITPVISTWKQLETISEIKKQKVAAHIKFDTGMNRVGFKTDDLSLLISALKTSKQIDVQGVLSHLHSAEDLDQSNSTAKEQITQFESIVKQMQLAKVIHAKKAALHLYNSAGISHKIEGKVQIPDFGIRPGLSIYGYTSVPSSKLSLKPVLSIRSKISMLKKVGVGETVSYGATWKATLNSVIAVLPFGYADGYMRQLSNRSHALLMGEKVPLIGNICMDYLMLDVTQVVAKYSIEYLEDKMVTLVGSDEYGNLISAVELSDMAKTIPWHILTSISRRIPRYFITEKKEK